jgi:hypothetical protein
MTKIIKLMDRKEKFSNKQKEVDHILPNKKVAKK